MEIAVIAGSTRPGRKARAVSDWVLQQARSRGDARYALIDVAELDLPLLDEELPAALGQYAQRHTRRWADQVAGKDGFVFVTPEYNHAPAAALKNAIDFLFAEWHDKAAGFVSYGVAGGVRAVEQLRLVLGEVKVADVRSAVGLSLSDDFEDSSAFAPRPKQVDAVHRMLDEVVAWAGALRAVRAA